MAIKKNGKSAFVKNGRAYITTSKNFKAWERTATVSLLQEKVKTRTLMPIQSPINLQCKFYFPNHQWEPDLSNLYQGIEDILQSIGVIKDDRLIYSHDGSRKVFGSETFHVEIEITEHIPTKNLQFLPNLE